MLQKSIQMIDKIHIIIEDCLVTIHSVTRTADISIKYVCNISHKKLKTEKLCAQ